MGAGFPGGIGFTHQIFLGHAFIHRRYFDCLARGRFDHDLLFDLAIDSGDFFQSGTGILDQYAFFHGLIHFRHDFLDFLALDVDFYRLEDRRHDLDAVAGFLHPFAQCVSEYLGRTCHLGETFAGLGIGRHLVARNGARRQCARCKVLARERGQAPESEL